jgi:hypothetical protein
MQVVSQEGSTMNPDTTLVRVYEAPVVRVLGSVAELTQQGCDKRFGGSDGFTFMGQAIVCRST